MEGLDQCLSPPHHDFSMYQKSLSFAVWPTQYVPRGAESTCIAAYLLGQGVMEVAVGQTYWRIHKKISKNGENISIQMDRILIQQLDSHSFPIQKVPSNPFLYTQYDLTSPASTCKPKSPIQARSREKFLIMIYPTCQSRIFMSDFTSIFWSNPINSKRTQLALLIY